METKISVVITYYNKEELIFNALKSLDEQTVEPFEIIVVDDCSTKEISKQVVSRLKNEDSLHFIQTKANSGASKAKNTGIQNSRGNVIVLLDADDTLPKSAIEIIKNEFDKTNADFLFGDYILKNNNSENYVDCSMIANENRLDQRKLLRKWILLGTSPFKKELWCLVQGFNEAFPRIDDVDFHKRILLKNIKAIYINNIIYI